MYAFNRALSDSHYNELRQAPSNKNVRDKESNIKENRKETLDYFNTNKPLVKGDASIRVSEEKRLYFTPHNLKEEVEDNSSENKDKMFSFSSSESKEPTLMKLELTPTKKRLNRAYYRNLQNTGCAGIILFLAKVILEHYIKYIIADPDTKNQELKSLTSLKIPESDKDKIIRLVFMEGAKNIAGPYMDYMTLDLTILDSIRWKFFHRYLHDYPLSSIKNKDMFNILYDYKENYNRVVYDLYNVVATTGWSAENSGSGLQHALQIMQKKNAPYIIAIIGTITHGLLISITKKVKDDETYYKIHLCDPTKVYYEKTWIKNNNDINSKIFAKTTIFDCFNSDKGAKESLSVEYLVCKFDAENTQLLTNAGLDKMFLSTPIPETSLQGRVNYFIDILIVAAMNNNLTLLKWLKLQINNDPDKDRIIRIMNYSEKDGKRSLDYENYGTACLIYAIKLKFFDIAEFLVNEFGVSVMQEGVPVKYIRSQESLGESITTALKEVKKTKYKEDTKITTFIQTAAIKENQLNK